MFLSFMLSVIFALTNAQFDGDDCLLAHVRENGVCKNALDCPKVYEIYRQGLPFTTCSYTSGNHIVCCPIERKIPVPVRPQISQTGDRVSQQQCKFFKSQVVETVSYGGLTTRPVLHQVSAETCDVSTPLIVGGTVTQKGEFPHMAALGFSKLNEIEFYCGGSLISDKFVLTAAHCKKSNKDTFARLGDQNVRSTQDGIKGVDIPIAEFIKHEKYTKRSKQNDIALVRLIHPVQISNFIRPACLWSQSLVSQTTVTATGWGFTEYGGSNSDDLLKVQLNILDNTICSRALEEAGFVLTQNNICAGVLQGGKDTCQGDSGGPIQIILPDNKCIYYIIGVTSFGVGCGIKNTPSVYTRVAAYLDWIEPKVWG